MRGSRRDRVVASPGAPVAVSRWISLAASRWTSLAISLWTSVAISLWTPLDASAQAPHAAAARLWPTAAQPLQEEPVATRTRAARGMGWGAALGGVLGGFGVGVLASGLCDAADCDGSFGEGFVVGMTMGAAAGAVTGVVVGSAFAADGRSTGGWTWSLTGGARRAVGADDIDGSGPALGLRALHATTERTRFGLAIEYLGTASHASFFQIERRDGSLQDMTDHREWWLSSVRLVAARFLGSRPGGGGYLLGGTGVYPTWERLTFTRDLGSEGVERSTERSFVVAPGVGLGAGYVFAVGGGWTVDLVTRADAVAGVGSDGVAGILQLTVGLLRR